ncbi:hypothetical protein ACRAQ6_13875 [Erythrobacter sp. HA6-11]
MTARPRPGGPTTLEGLASYFGEASWPQSMMQAGVDFGHSGALVDASLHPLWDASNRRLAFLGNRNRTQMRAENYKIERGLIDIASPTVGRVPLKNIHVDSQGESFFGISMEGAGEDAWLDAERGTLTNQKSLGAMLRHGVINRYDIYSQQSDGIRMLGMKPKRVKDTFIHQLGIGDPSSHSDGIQGGGNVSDFVIWNSTVYLPGSNAPGDDTIYYEGANGVTNCLNWNTDGGNFSNLIAINCLLIGGGYTVNLSADAGTQVANMALIGCRFSDHVTNEHTAYGAFYPTTEGPTYNLVAHECTYKDGSPVMIRDQVATGKIWDWNASLANASEGRWTDFMQALGYLNSSNVPQVATASGFHLAA